MELDEGGSLPFRNFPNFKTWGFILQMYIRFCTCTHTWRIRKSAFVRKRAILWTNKVVLLSSRFPFAYFLLFLKVKCAINTMVLQKVSAPGCICTVKATRFAIHHWNDSFEISAQCIDKWFSLGYKPGTKNKKKKKNNNTALCFFSVVAWH